MKNKSSKKKTKKVKAWILEFGGFFKPMITWEKPTAKEIKTAKDYGSEYYECEITYKNDQSLKQTVL